MLISMTAVMAEDKSNSCSLIRLDISALPRSALAVFAENGMEHWWRKSPGSRLVLSSVHLAQGHSNMQIAGMVGWLSLMPPEPQHRSIFFPLGGQSFSSSSEFMILVFVTKVIPPNKLIAVQSWRNKDKIHIIRFYAFLMHSCWH